MGRSWGAAAAVGALLVVLLCPAPWALARARHRAPGVIPVPALQLDAPMRAYRAYVRELLGTLRGQLAGLSAALRSGDVPGAESDWLTAHLTWLRIGQDDGAYGAFGQLGRQIDGTAAGLVGGVDDPQFTGFHKVELDLWTRGDVAAATADAAVLSELVARLAARPLGPELPMTPVGLSIWTLRAHEILEDALRDSLSGDDEYGSGTALASVMADVGATREMLSLLAPVIAPRSPRLVGRARRQLDAVVGAAQAGQVNGRWVAVSELPTAARERVDAAVGAVLETLAPIPDLLQVAGGT
ncbi:MAG TPA: EfeM/EfeO family lipoprotein [Solirubrobacteraceae bacterium]|nr:EfeM/EfeO family lipoprotein [Solirubrobacteraceae bacterium]